MPYIVTRHNYRSMATNIRSMTKKKKEKFCAKSAAANSWVAIETRQQTFIQEKKPKTCYSTAIPIRFTHSHGLKWKNSFIYVSGWATQNGYISPELGKSSQRITSIQNLSWYFFVDFLIFFLQSVWIAMSRFGFFCGRLQIKIL